MERVYLLNELEGNEMMLAETVKRGSLAHLLHRLLLSPFHSHPLEIFHSSLFSASKFRVASF